MQHTNNYKQMKSICITCKSIYYMKWQGAKKLEFEQQIS